MVEGRKIGGGKTLAVRPGEEHLGVHPTLRLTFLFGYFQNKEYEKKNNGIQL